MEIIIMQGIINVKSFQARTEGVRPEGPRCEARRAESGVGPDKFGGSSRWSRSNRMDDGVCHMIHSSVKSPLSCTLAI